MTLNPDFKAPARPFRRMRYNEAIEWLNAHSAMDENGVPHVFGTDIAEAAGRKMTDEIGVPIMLTHFPVPIKTFYMKRDVNDDRVTESVDCLVPGVGEVVGSGMRMDNYEDLIKVMEENKWDLKAYAFYSDQQSKLHFQMYKADLTIAGTERCFMEATEWELRDSLHGSSSVIQSENAFRSQDIQANGE